MVWSGHVWIYIFFPKPKVNSSRVGSGHFYLDWVRPGSGLQKLDGLSCLGKMYVFSFDEFVQ